MGNNKGNSSHTIKHLVTTTWIEEAKNILFVGFY
jgi:hypothetical protein